MIRVAAIVFVTLLSVFTVAAASPTHSASFDACARAAHGATLSLLHCYSEEAKLVDDAMAVALVKVEGAASDPRSVDYLKRSQAAWNGYRDAWCEATVPRLGSLARLKLFECRLAETRRRTEELRSLLP